MHSGENFEGSLLMVLLIVMCLLPIVELVAVALLLQLQNRRRARRISERGQMTPDGDALLQKSLPIPPATAPAHSFESPLGDVGYCTFGPDIPKRYGGDILDKHRVADGTEGDDPARKKGRRQDDE